jgi:hypothetical protein
VASAGVRGVLLPVRAPDSDGPAVLALAGSRVENAGEKTYRICQGDSDA